VFAQNVKHGFMILQMTQHLTLQSSFFCDCMTVHVGLTVLNKLKSSIRY